MKTRDTRYRALRGSPRDVIAVLEDKPATELELRLALQNAFGRLERIEYHLERLWQRAEKEDS